MVTATKIYKGEEITHEFSDNNWLNLPKDKDGWVETVKAVEKPNVLIEAEAAKAKAESNKAQSK